MKNIVLLLAWCFLGTVSAMAQTRVVSSGRLASENLNSPSRTVTEVADGYEVTCTFPDYEGSMDNYNIAFSAPNHRPLILQNTGSGIIAKAAPDYGGEESMINENLVWQYHGKSIRYDEESNEYAPGDYLLNFQFNGTSEINGKTYHNLYGMGKWENGVTREDMFTDFSFERDPDFYIRQDGDKYYMLMNPKSEVLDFMEGWYGSPEVESLIYDYSPDSYVLARDGNVHRGFEICTEKRGDSYPDGYEHEIFIELTEHSPLFYDFSKTIIYKEGVSDLNKLMGLKSDVKRNIRYQSNNFSYNLYNYGTVGSGILPMPGAYTFPGITYTISFNNVYDLDGNIVYKGRDWRPTVSSVSDIVEDSVKVNFSDGVLNIDCAGEVSAELISTDGRRVWSGHGDGVMRVRPDVNCGTYILRVISSEGSITHKIISK